MANFGQNPWTNPYWKISIFWIFLKNNFSCLKSDSFLSRISKTMFPGSICRKTTIEKDGHFLAKNHGIHLLKNILFLYFFKVHYCLKSILLYPEYQINDVSLLDMPKTRHSKKWPFLAKNYRLTPLENFDFLEFFLFFENWLFLSKQNFFLSRTSETMFPDWICPKTSNTKNNCFWPKTMD